MSRESLIFKAGWEAGAFNAGLKKMEHDTESATHNIIHHFKQQGNAIQNTFLEAFTLTALTEGIHKVIEFGSEIRNSAIAAGISTDAYQGLSVAFEHSGTSAQQFDVSLSKLAVNIEAAKGGSEEMVEKFNKIGISWQQLHDLSVDEILLKVADAVKEAESPTRGMAIAVELLGKSGKFMAGALREGGEALREHAEEATKASESEIESLHKIEIAYAQLGRKSKTFFGQLLVDEVEGWKTLNENIGHDMDALFGKQAPELSEFVGRRKQHGEKWADHKDAGPSPAELKRSEEERAFAAKREIADGEHALKLFEQMLKTKESIAAMDERTTATREATFAAGLTAEGRLDRMNSERAETLRLISRLEGEAKSKMEGQLATLDQQIAKEKEITKELTAQRNLAAMQEALGEAQSEAKLHRDNAYNMLASGPDARRQASRDATRRERLESESLRPHNAIRDFEKERTKAVISEDSIQKLTNSIADAVNLLLTK